MNHSFAPGAMEVLIGLDEKEIRHAAERLLGCHATDLPKFIAAPWDDYDLIFSEDGTAVIVLRMWAEMVPPFRHAVVRIKLLFENGVVTEIEGVSRKSFEA